MEGVFLAASMVAIYLIFGPLVLLGVYIIFDRFAEYRPKPVQAKYRDLKKHKAKQASLWTSEDVEKFFQLNKN